MADDYKVQFIVPAYNSCGLIEETLQSIWRQNYNSDLIFTTVMDFGSTDGTYGKLIKYAGKNLGIYRHDKMYDRRLEIAIIVNLLERLYGEQRDYYYVVLLPGEVVYPDFVKKCIDAYKQENSLEIVICETDIMYGGELLCQEPLFSYNQVLVGNHDNYCMDYVNRGARHQVHCMVKSLQNSLHRASSEINEGRWWNKLGRVYKYSRAYYLNKALACQLPIVYDDELEEILLRWESLIYQRKVEEPLGYNDKKEEYYKEANQRLAEYAVWRSDILRNTDDRQSEDCLRIAEVIHAMDSP